MVGKRPSRDRSIFRSSICVFFFILAQVFLFELHAQSIDLANSFFRKGEYEKAIMLYEPLYEENPIRQDYFKALLTCYQQLEQYDKAQGLIEKQQLTFPNQAYLLVELGYNFKLQGKQAEAETLYQEALEAVRQRPNLAFVVGRSFRMNHELDYALNTYQLAKAADPKLNTELSEAQIYGEQGELAKMFSLYLDLVDKNENYLSTAQRFMGPFISEDPKDPNNLLLKKDLLTRAQTQPKNSWNMLLSWLFMQEGQYARALTQEKSIYKRQPVSLERIFEIGRLAYASEDWSVAKDAFGFILDKGETQGLDVETNLQAEIFMLKIAKKNHTYSL